jgi:hypothetical protein
MRARGGTRTSSSKRGAEAEQSGIGVFSFDQQRSHLFFLLFISFPVRRYRTVLGGGWWGGTLVCLFCLFLLGFI